MCRMSDEYTATVGLEVHAELKTQTKMFCVCKNDPDEKRPNVNVCPVCMAHPGTLPVINKAAVEHVLKVGLALGGRLATEYTEFDRKSYFYPDLPKGYQISQYEFPLVEGGELVGVAITRVHLEEDTARSSHADDSGDTLIDFNRGGVPLMELVTEPVIHDAATAGTFARELQLLLRTIGASEANMEKGEMRVEANISVSNTAQLGTKVEVKNLNSFKSVERAIAYEIGRQVATLRSGGEVAQETRGWDENKQQTVSQRTKEGAADYRYFPDPDLPKLKLSDLPEFARETLMAEMPELPQEYRARLMREFNLRPEDVERYVVDRQFGMFFERVASKLPVDVTAKLASNLIINNLAALEAQGHITDKLDAEQFAEIVALLHTGSISSNSAVALIAALVAGETGNMRIYAEQHGFIQENDIEALRVMVKDILEAHPSVVAEYKAGKGKALAFLIGKGMQESKGSANPQVLSRLLSEELS